MTPVGAGSGGLTLNLTDLWSSLLICRSSPAGNSYGSQLTGWAVIVRMRFHQPTRDYVARRTADGRTKREIIRCLKRFLAREIYQRVMTDFPHTPSRHPGRLKRVS